MPADEDDAAERRAHNAQTNNADGLQVSGLASAGREDGSASVMEVCYPNRQGQTLRRPPVPQTRFENFSGHDPSSLCHNISKTASNALPPPFKNGIYLPLIGGHLNRTEADDSRLRQIPRKPNYAENDDERACSSRSGRRYEPCVDASFDQQREDLCDQYDHAVAQDGIVEDHDLQWEAGERASCTASERLPVAPVISDYPFAESFQAQHYCIAANGWRTTWEPIRQAPTITPGENLNEQIEPPPKRRKTTNTEPPSHPPGNATYQPGTDPIPTEIASIVAQIKSLPRKRGNKGYPMPTKLRSVPGMNRRIGFISKSSPLMPWYGDTRLFTAKWWMWLYVGGKARKELERELGESDEVDR